MSQRPKRTIKPPKPVYVPDEDIQFADDLSVDSDFDDDESLGITESEEEDYDSDEDEYDMNDGFVVPDDYEDSDLDTLDEDEESEYITSDDDDEDDDDESIVTNEEDAVDPATLIQPSSN